MICEAMKTCRMQQSNSFLSNYWSAITGLPRQAIGQTIRGPLDAQGDQSRDQRCPKTRYTSHPHPNPIDLPGIGETNNFILLGSITPYQRKFYYSEKNSCPPKYTFKTSWEDTLIRNNFKTYPVPVHHVISDHPKNHHLSQVWTPPIEYHELEELKPMKCQHIIDTFHEGWGGTWSLFLGVKLAWM